MHMYNLNYKVIIHKIIIVINVIATVVIVISTSSGAEDKLKPGSKEFNLKQDKLSKEFTVSPSVVKEKNRLEKKYPQIDIGQTKYQRSGHQYTTFIVARLARLSTEKSYTLAFYSQLPDDEIEFSATLAFFYLFTPEYRRQIMADVHSLHGGDTSSVLKRREDLKQLIVNGINRKSLKDYQIGILIHAFADSYAHTYVEDGKVKAFSYTWGHLFHGDKPDLITYNPDLYKEYVCQLYKALSAADVCLPKLEKLYSMIEKLKTERNSELPYFEFYARKDLLYNDNDYAQYCKTLENVVSAEEMKNTIQIMESKFVDK